MSFHIPYGRQDIDNEDIQAVINVLKSDFLTQGPAVNAFEAAISSYVGVKYAVACNSATSALHLACLALGVGPGDIVWTSAITFVASSNCALYCGAEVDFVDINLATYNISLEALTEKLIIAKSSGNLPKVLIPVHMAGQSADMRAIYALSQEYGFKIIEDASHAIGGSYENSSIGSCKFSDIAVFSFHPVKIITTGEGGMAVTNNGILADKMNLLRSHGITRDPAQMQSKSDGPWYYEQIELGFNYRMTDIQAALGMSQSKKIGGYVLRRNELAERYKSVLRGLPITLPTLLESNYSAFHLFIILLTDGITKSRHLEVFSQLREAGIGVNIHYIPVYLQPYYQKKGFKKGYCPNAEEYYSRAVSLPIFPNLSIDQQDFVGSKLGEILKP
ncbi:UDP-4-amino-4,6-dideoxy-N-acetyl-beta-L-altrosamine transaminase [Polynucleobacter paneuropaeus]|jgi:UDP-4-amino-4,6-dideoxy-N-acetyl-beta-L-altrosamine transaminase|uniref:UDP-4-amino-4, 6-dideoxy-N-acetyl-beta-L-altrosamine transaminase n=1 Tax=Polynucleobacter paneuropaeus TaxID=2527775 RepID=UPI001BFEE3E6|nr:UDP-4-amino-4,6-dideoxy-N-acetyl-beta-L-altrosamine transaminase [Polynucleobacter paneuropaeus]MBT8621875.1 UDP-4-amino-4,6-dideoxy-N-acetyl-beta-L-altrosamine transaminase [Polynucleobacter paneuropaeus]